MKQDRFAEALGPLRASLRIKPDYAGACVALGKALMGMEKYGEAVDELLKCIVRNPNHPQPHLLLSQVYFRMGDEERAQNEKDISLRLRRQHPEMMEPPQTRPFPAGPR